MNKKIDHPDYKILISDLGINPFEMVKIAFILMSLIPFLSIFYLILGKNSFYDILLGTNGLLLLISLGVSCIGYVLAYNIISGMLKIMIKYYIERKQLDEEKTELFSAVTHDLKTPLTVIKLGMDNLMDGITGAITKEQAEIASFCREASEKGIKFINELLENAKTGFNNKKKLIKKIDFETIVKSEVIGIEKIAKENLQKINYTLSAKNFEIYGDEKTLARAVMNILSNAVKYSPKEGVIDILLSADDANIKLSVKNSGKGLTKQEINKIFDKGKRLDRDLMIEGSGFGLAIVKHIIELHKGIILVDSKPGLWTQFTIILPRYIVNTI
ncbi:multi-sensor signal transduction histidine kinase [Candidatus Omnitrophus magneticus]|uniref:histidine kinase n=1 Tax=Candidatus Omnitrophus magneticus TaxID=1609969 RepID=A0A0F0CVR9_9BACT|nr:multi-sensor signal transduction histidine kinase [Candidatus Omnitrophus magneticus]